jgi:threonine synthase
VAESAFQFEPELIELDEQFSLLDLTGGPTGVVIDYSVAYLAAVMEELLKNSAPVIAISASQGDVGISIANAFIKRRNILSVMLYPEGPIRGIDTEYLLKNGGNVIAIQVKGRLDDCNRLVHDLINDREFSDPYRITSANAINPGRLLAQTLYYFYAFIKLRPALKDNFMFSVPTGNLGNLIGGLYAWKFGLPASGFIAAQNINRPSKEALEGKPRGTRVPVATSSPALDVTSPSNYERLAAFYKTVPDNMKSAIRYDAVSDERMERALSHVLQKYGVLVDPHTAVAFASAIDIAKKENYSGHIVVLATGHPAKQPEIMARITKRPPPMPDRLAGGRKMTEPICAIPPDISALEAAIAGCIN